jgi:hypothetical protein
MSTEGVCSNAPATPKPQRVAKPDGCFGGFSFGFELGFCRKALPSFLGEEERAQGDVWMLSPACCNGVNVSVRKSLSNDASSRRQLDCSNDN